MQPSWLSQISAVLKIGNGRQGHSWVRIPPAADRAECCTVELFGLASWLTWGST